MKKESLIRGRDLLRNNWHDVRAGRLDFKNTLLEKGIAVIEIRHNSDYKKLKKEQRRISKMIRHLEKKICREIKNEAK